MGVALGVAPLWAPFNAGWMGGQLWATGTGYTLQKVPYDNLFPFNSNAHLGMVALGNYLEVNPGTTEEPTLVATHSMGGQVAHKWMRERGPTSGIDPATVRFYMSGNPEMPIQGASFLQPSKYRAVYPGTTGHSIFCPTPSQHHGGWGVGFGPPPDCPWDITYVVGEWDGWCYWPNRDGEDAVRNAKAGQQATGSHGWYQEGRFDNPRNRLWTDPETGFKYLVIPNELPMLNSVRDAYTKESETRRLLPIILESYDLPWQPPPVDPDPRVPDEVRKSLFIPTVSPAKRAPKANKPKPWWQWW